MREIARRRLVDGGDLGDPLAPFLRGCGEREELLHDLERARPVVLAAVDDDEALERRDVTGRPPQHLLQRDLRAGEVDGVLGVELAEALVDAQLLGGVGHEAHQPHPRLLGGVPVLERRAEVGVRREGDDVVGLRRQRRLERAARGERLAHGDERGWARSTSRRTRSPSSAVARRRSRRLASSARAPRFV